MIFDWDDFAQDNHRIDLLNRLKGLRPDFRCTVFAIPAKGTPEFWDTIPDWIELAVHGWQHGDPPADGGECKDWSYERMMWLIGQIGAEPRHANFVHGFKAPGWQISTDALQALADADWWVADQPYNNNRRPQGLRCHLLGSPYHWHGHIQNVCDNGLEETFAHVARLVEDADNFEFMSEVVQPWA